MLEVTIENVHILYENWPMLVCRCTYVKWYVCQSFSRLHFHLFICTHFHNTLDASMPVCLHIVVAIAIFAFAFDFFMAMSLFCSIFVHLYYRNIYVCASVNKCVFKEN